MTEPHDYVDLHSHTLYSDGLLSPAELVEKAGRIGLSALAITDHDNVDAIPEALVAGEEFGVEIISGVELSCAENNRPIDIVGLFIEPDEIFQQQLSKMREQRVKRMHEMIARLNALDVNVSLADIAQTSERSFGRPHLAQALVDKGIVNNPGEAFALYLSDSGSVNVPKLRFTVREAVTMIHRIGGVAVLAHPGVSRVVEDIPTLATYGLDGVEAYYPKHARDTEERVLVLAAENNLLPSGGSDFHGFPSGSTLGVSKVERSVMIALREKRPAEKIT